MNVRSHPWLSSPHSMRQFLHQTQSSPPCSVLLASSLSASRAPGRPPHLPKIHVASGDLTLGLQSHSHTAHALTTGLSSQLTRRFFLLFWFLFSRQVLNNRPSWPKTSQSCLSLQVWGLEALLTLPFFKIRFLTIVSVWGNSQWA